MPVTGIVVKGDQSELVQMSPSTSGLFGDAMYAADDVRGPSDISSVRFCGGSISRRTDIAVPLILLGAALVAGGATLAIVGRTRGRRRDSLPTVH